MITTIANTNFLKMLEHQKVWEASRWSDNMSPALGFQKLRGHGQTRPLRAAVSRQRYPKESPAPPQDRCEEPRTFKELDSTPSNSY